MMPMSFSNSSSATSTSGNAQQGGSGTGNGFYVNFGNGVSQGGGIPTSAWVALLLIGGLWAWKRFT